jgi:hypothetical protein
MIPLAEDLLAEIEKTGSPAGGGSVAGAFEFLSPEIENWARSLSSDTPIAYFETEYVAGEGFERAAVWSGGQIALGPLDGAGSINQALRALGVRPGPGIEEFEHVGLGRHRSLDEWLQDA